MKEVDKFVFVGGSKDGAELPIEYFGGVIAKVIAFPMYADLEKHGLAMCNEEYENREDGRWHYVRTTEPFSVPLDYGF